VKCHSFSFFEKSKWTLTTQQFTPEILETLQKTIKECIGKQKPSEETPATPDTRLRPRTPHAPTSTSPKQSTTSSKPHSKRPRLGHARRAQQDVDSQVDNNINDSIVNDDDEGLTAGTERPRKMKESGSQKIPTKQSKEDDIWDAVSSIKRDIAMLKASQDNPRKPEQPALPPAATQHTLSSTQTPSNTSPTFSIPVNFPSSIGGGGGGTPVILNFVKM
jgi:hypothetical protein